MVKAVKGRAMKGRKAVFFVELQDSLALRRNALQCLRSILDTLQKYHDFQRKKEQKTQKVAELRSIINRANALLLTLKSTLPHIEFKEPRKPKQPRQEKAGRADNAGQQVPEMEADASPRRHRSELDALEAELAAIERKLNKLV